MDNKLFKTNMNIYNKTVHLECYPSGYEYNLVLDILITVVKEDLIIYYLQIFI